MRLPKGTYAAIVADPPWAFEDRGTRLAPSYAGKQRKDPTKQHYSVLPLSEICALPVQALAAEDAYLFLWIPAALRESPYYVLDGAPHYTQTKKDVQGQCCIPRMGFHRAVMEAWGFTPTGAEMVWVKGRIPPVAIDVPTKVAQTATVRVPGRRVMRILPGENVSLQPQLRLRIGGGHTVRNAHEVCVIGRRGKPNRLDKGVPSVIVEPRGPHSTKPDTFYRLVERLCGGPYLDLYGRALRQGWTVWGDQVGT